MWLVFCFKQKTAYEMRISDWSSDVCSSDLIDIDAISEYRDGEILLTLTDAEKPLDAANRKRAQEELIKQAKGTTPMSLAQGAARTAIEQSFDMPPQAAGNDAKVPPRFADPSAGETPGTSRFCPYAIPPPVLDG